MATRGWNFTLDEFSDRMGSIFVPAEEQLERGKSGKKGEEG